MAIFFAIVGSLIITAGLILTGTSLKEAPVYIKDVMFLYL